MKRRRRRRRKAPPLRKIRLALSATLALQHHLPAQTP